jgi:hypothetical protein
MDISSIIPAIDTNVLNEEAASAIAEAFETAVNEKVNAQVELQVEGALSKQDEEHASKLGKLLEAIDADHSEKLKKVVNAINENHASKLIKIVNYVLNIFFLTFHENITIFKRRRIKSSR